MSNKFGKRYEGKLKIEICKSIEEGTITFSEAIRKYELNDSTLCGWLRMYRSGRKEELLNGRPLGKQKGNVYKPRGYDILENKKNMNLDEKIRYLQMENDYYKRLLNYLTEENNEKVKKKSKFK